MERHSEHEKLQKLMRSYVPESPMSRAERTPPRFRADGSLRGHDGLLRGAV